MEEKRKQNSEWSRNLEYISLAAAAKFCPYSEHYLRLRSRQGKLKSIKLGKKWMTTRAWLDDYQRQVGDWRAAAEKKKTATGKAAPPPELAEVIFSHQSPMPLPPLYRAGFCTAENVSFAPPKRRLAGFVAGQIFPPPRPSKVSGGQSFRFGAIASGALAALLFFAAVSPQDFSPAINFDLKNIGQANVSFPAAPDAEKRAPDFAVHAAPAAAAWQIEENSLERLVETLAGWMEKIAGGEN
jgi:hypothetical protein